MSARFDVFPEHDAKSTPDEIQRWWWHLVAANGEVVCRSSESYRDKADAKRGCTDAAHAMAEVNEIRVLDEEDSG